MNLSFKSLLYSVHRICGVLICCFFLMWFVSGLVLIYYPFPNVSESQLNKQKEEIRSSINNADLLLGNADSLNCIYPKSLIRFQEQDLFTYVIAGNTETVPLLPYTRIKDITKETIYATAKRWVDAAPLKIDTLTERDQWIMYTRYLEELPIYKFYYADPEKHQLYISSRSGEVLQFTTQTDRFWAWIGAIPHKFYIPCIRKSLDLWIGSLTVAGIIGMVVSLTGLSLGLIVLYNVYKKKRIIRSPYKKHAYSWHYITGLIFGLFLLTWAFSGAIAMHKVPQTIVKTYGDYRVSPAKVRGKALPLSAYQADCSQALASVPGVRKLIWRNFGEIPVYEVVTADTSYYWDASSDRIKPFYLSESEVKIAIMKVHGHCSVSVDKMTQYDNYYLSRKAVLPLPVYRVTVDNPDKSVYYLNPKTGDFKYVNRNARVKKWLFSGLHYLQIDFLIKYPIVWTILIWALCIGGSIVSFTGILLSMRYLMRKIRHLCPAFFRENC